MSKNVWPAPTMMLATNQWANMESFSLLPITNDSPFVECLYNPHAKTLAIIGKTKKETFHMIPRLTDEGHPMPLKNGATAENPHKKQRVQQESYTEYYLTVREEIEAFIQNFAINADTFDYKKALNMKTMDDPSPIAKGPVLLTSKD